MRSIKGEKADIWLETETQAEGSKETIQPAVTMPIRGVSSKRIDQFRDDIAKKMWEDY